MKKSTSLTSKFLENFTFDLCSFVIVQFFTVLSARNTERFQDRNLNPLTKQKTNKSSSDMRY